MTVGASDHRALVNPLLQHVMCNISGHLLF